MISTLSKLQNYIAMTKILKIYLPEIKYIYWSLKAPFLVIHVVIYIYIKESRKIVLVTPFIIQEWLYQF